MFFSKHSGFGQFLELRPMGIVQAHTPQQVAQARELFVEYAAGLGIDLCFQNFDQELAGLPGSYAPPDGRLLLAFDQGILAGCVGLRKFDDMTCEMKRLYVRPSFRGHKFGHRLVLAIIEEARRIGYGRMRLDTLPSMGPAIKMYRLFGFQETEPYTVNPIPGVLFMELQLG